MKKRIDAGVVPSTQNGRGSHGTTNSSAGNVTQKKGKSKKKLPTTDSLRDQLTKRQQRYLEGSAIAQDQKKATQNSQECSWVRGRKK